MRKQINYKQKLTLNALATILIMPLGLISVPIYTKSLSSGDYGMFTFFFTVINFTQPFIGLGTGTSFSRDFSGLNSLLRSKSYFTVFNFKLLNSILFALIFLILNQSFQILPSEIENISLLIIGYFLVLPIEPLQNRFLRVAGKIKLLSLIKICEAYIYVFIAYFVLVLFDKGTSEILIALLLAHLIRIIIVQIKVSEIIGFTIKTFDKQLLKEYLKFGLSTLPSSLSTFIVDLTDRFIIVFFLGTKELAYYTVAYTLMFIPKFSSNILNFILFEEYNQLRVKKQVDKANELIKNSIEIFLMATLGCYPIILFFGQRIITIFASEEYSQNSYVPTNILFFGFIFFGLYSLLNKILLSEGNKKVLINTWAIALPINIIINISFVKTYGIIAASTATLISYMIIFIYSLHKSKFKDFGFKLKWDEIIIPIVLIITMGTLKLLGLDLLSWIASFIYLLGLGYFILFKKLKNFS